MSEELQKPNKSTENLPSSSSSSNGGSSSSSSNGITWEGEKPQKIPYPNPRETSIPDPTTLREQWRFAIRQYGKWYSHAWGTAILAGGAFFALGWFIKGSNPLPSLQSEDRRTTEAKSEPKPSADRAS